MFGESPEYVAMWHLKPQIGHNIGFQAPSSTKQHPIRMGTK